MVGRVFPRHRHLGRPLNFIVSHPKVNDRDHIPAEVKRAVLVEAGHRCAIPTCKATTTEVAHIVPWSESRTIRSRI
jgi:hypothetical protein